MKVAHFIGNHTKDTPGVRLGWWLTRLVQKGKYKEVTHCEAILAEHEDGSVTIGSATLRKETGKKKSGVRIKQCFLTPGNWLISDVTSWDRIEAAAWFAEHDGEEYDRRGAFTSWIFIMWERIKEWFCSEAVAASVKMKTPALYGPSLFADVCFSHGVDVTEEFFSARATV